MFYEENELKDLINCPRCNQRQVEPKIIVPCFKTLCVSCVKELSDDNSFDCFFCNTKHVVPDDGFPANTSVELLLKLKPKEIHKNNKLMNELKDKFKIFTSLLDDYSSNALGLESSLYEHCAQLRNQIDLSCDEKIVQINMKREKCLKYIDEYIDSCLTSVTENKNHIDFELKRFKDLFEQCNKFVNSFEIDEKQVEERIFQIQLKIEQLKLAINNLESIKFNGKKVSFEIDESEINLDFIGKFNETKFKKIEYYQIISGSKDTCLKVWSPNDGECTQTLAGHTCSILCLTVLDNQTIVSGSADNTLKIWNLIDGLCTQTLEGHTDFVFALASIDRNTIVSGSLDQTIKIWNVENAGCIMTLSGHGGQVSSVSVINKSKLVTGSTDMTLKIWNLDTGKCIETLTGHKDSIFCLAKINEHRIVSGGLDNSLKIWDIQSSGKCLATLDGHTNHVYCVLALNSNTIVSGSKDKTIKIWNLNENQTSGTCVKTLEDHTGTVRCLTSAGKDSFISGSEDLTIKVWDLDHFECTRELNGHSSTIYCLSTLP